MPIILVSDENSNDSSINFLKNRSIKKSYIVGGNRILSDNAVKNIQTEKESVVQIEIILMQNY